MITTTQNKQSVSIKKVKAILANAYKTNEIMNWEYDSLLYGVKKIEKYLEKTFEGESVTDIKTFLETHKVAVDVIVQRELKGIYDDFVVIQLAKHGEVESIKHQLLAEYAATVKNAYEIRFKQPSGVKSQPADGYTEATIFHDGTFLVDNPDFPLPVFTEEQVAFVIEGFMDYTSNFEIQPPVNKNDAYTLYYRYETTQLSNMTAFVEATKILLDQFVKAFGTYEERLAAGCTLNEEVINQWGK